MAGTITKFVLLCCCVRMSVFIRRELSIYKLARPFWEGQCVYKARLRSLDKLRNGQVLFLCHGIAERAVKTVDAYLHLAVFRVLYQKRQQELICGNHVEALSHGVCTIFSMVDEPVEPTESMHDEGVFDPRREIKLIE